MQKITILATSETEMEKLFAKGYVEIWNSKMTRKLRFCFINPDESNNYYEHVKETVIIIPCCNVHSLFYNLLFHYFNFHLHLWQEFIIFKNIKNPTCKILSYSFKIHEKIKLTSLIKFRILDRELLARSSNVIRQKFYHFKK